MQLGVNVDHVATLRNLRDTSYPSVIEVAKIAIAHGADFITVHIREDRRHIRDKDLLELKAEITAPINLEMAATDEMVSLAKRMLPESVCIVPEKREERTTESGIDAARLFSALLPVISDLKSHGIKTTLFIDPQKMQIEYAKKLAVDKVELHVGQYCIHHQQQMFEEIREAARYATELGLQVHAGHGIDYTSAKSLATLTNISALNIGHFIICEAVTHGIAHVVEKMKKIITAQEEVTHRQ